MTLNKPAIRGNKRAISKKRAIGGFTLIEILVALIILGLSLGVIMQIFSAGLERARKTETRAVAVQLAESKLAAIGIEEPLTEGVTDGQFDERFRWRVLVQLYRPAGGDEPSDGGDETRALVHAYAVNVRVFWGDGGGGDGGDGGDDGTVSLSTVRLVKAD